MEQILISAYTLDNLLNAGREIAVGNVAGFTGRIDNVISIFGIVVVATYDVTGIGVIDNFLFGPLGAGVGAGLILIFG